MRFPNQRLAQLFDALQNDILPQDELARRFAVSTRTVRNDIQALNALLVDHGAMLVLNRGRGYQLKVNNAARYHQLLQHNAPSQRVPRTSQARVPALLIRFLTSAFSLKLEVLADEWFVSRNTLQSDMIGVREWLERYQLVIETRPRYGMKLFGRERDMRTALTDLLWQLTLDEGDNAVLWQQALDGNILASLEPMFSGCLTRLHIRLTDDGERYLRLYCAVAARRISEGFPLTDFSADPGDDDVRQAARRIIAFLRSVTGKAMGAAEEAWLRVNIAGRRQVDTRPDMIGADDGDSLVDYILGYINRHYNFSLQDDAQLRADLLTHIRTMLARLRYRIHIPNPLLSNIKQHYPMAWDITLAAVTSWGKHTPYHISENEMGFLVLHIGVGLERHYNVSWQRYPRVMLVCDTGNSTIRMIQALLLRKYPQIEVTQVVSLREYEQRQRIDEDFVVSTVRLSDKSKPVVVMSPFPGDFQLEQLGQQVLQDRTRPYMLEKFFDASHFLILDAPIDSQTLFRQLSDQLEQEGIVGSDFYPSVVEREAIVSTMLGEGIALPHSLGLLANKTCVYTVLAPGGIAWGEDTAYVIFLLAISKSEYEEAMAIYDLFVTFMRERAIKRLRDSTDFAGFKTVALDCLSRL